MGRRSGTSRRSRNCVDLILDFCKNNIKNRKCKNQLKAKIEKTYRLG